MSCRGMHSIHTKMLSWSLKPIVHGIVCVGTPYAWCCFRQLGEQES